MPEAIARIENLAVYAILRLGIRAPKIWRATPNSTKNNQKLHNGRHDRRLKFVLSIIAAKTPSEGRLATDPLKTTNILIIKLILVTNY